MWQATSPTSVQSFCMISMPILADETRASNMQQAEVWIDVDLPP
jgi:hypothetical protein